MALPSNPFNRYFKKDRPLRFRYSNLDNSSIGVDRDSGIGKREGRDKRLLLLLYLEALEE